MEEAGGVEEEGDLGVFEGVGEGEGGVVVDVEGNDAGEGEEGHGYEDGGGE